MCCAPGPQTHTDALAAGLEEVGFRRGDRVLGWLTNRSELVVTQLAALRYGFHFVGVPPSFGWAPLQAVVQLSGHRELPARGLEGAVTPPHPDPCDVSARWGRGLTAGGGLAFPHTVTDARYEDLVNPSVVLRWARGQQVRPVQCALVLQPYFGERDNHELLHRALPQVAAHGDMGDLAGRRRVVVPSLPHLREIITVHPFRISSAGFQRFTGTTLYHPTHLPCWRAQRVLASSAPGLTSVTRVPRRPRVRHGLDPQDVAMLPDDLELRLQTWSHRDILDQITPVAQALELTGDDAVATVLPLCHAAGALLGPLIALDVGASVVLPSPEFEPHTVLRHLTNERWTVLIGMPSQWEALREALEAGVRGSPHYYRKSQTQVVSQSGPAPPAAYLLNVPYSLDSLRAGVVVVPPPGDPQHADVCAASQNLVRGLGIPQVYCVHRDPEDGSVQVQTTPSGPSAPAGA